MVNRIKNGIVTVAIFLLMCAAIPFQARADTGTVAGLTITSTATVTSGTARVNTAAVSIGKDSATLTVKAKSGKFAASTTVKGTYTIQNTTGNKVFLSFILEKGALSETPTVSGCPQIRGSDGVLRYQMIMDPTAKFTISGSASGTYLLEGTATYTLKEITVTPILNNVSMTVNYDSTQGSVKYGSSAVASGTAFTVTNAGTVLTATPKNGYSFVAWMDSAGTIVSTQPSYALYLTEGDPTELTAMFTTGTTGYYMIKSTGVIYPGLNEAIAAAGSATETIILVNDATLPAGNYTIPSNITLLIPFDDEGTVIRDNMENHTDARWSSSYPGGFPAITKFKQLTMENGANITIQSGGSISIGGRASCQMVGQVGPYGVIKMNSGSNITVQHGGFLYAWGYILHGSNGSGTVTVENGGTVYEPMSAVDYPNNAGTTVDLYNDSKIFPLRAFTIRNVEVPMTLHYGAKEYVFYSFYGTTAGHRAGDVLMIGSSDAPFQLSSGTTLTKSYASGIQYIVGNGNFALNSISLTFTAAGIDYPISSSDTSGFPVPSGFDMTLASGTLTLGDSVVMTEGSKITIAEGATVDTNGKNLYVLDATEDPGAISVKDFHGVAYSKVDKDAVLDVNGTLITSGGFYTSTSGASIISSGGTGVIENGTGASGATSVNIKSARNVASTVSVVPAILTNADKTTVSSTQDTYTYLNGYWHRGTGHIWNGDSTCDLCKETAVAIWNYSTTDADGTVEYVKDYYMSIAEVLSDEDYNGTGYVQLQKTTSEAALEVNKNLVLDLFGNKVENAITVASGVSFTGIDTKTDDYTEPTGSITGNFTGISTYNGKHYLGIYDSTTGKTQFHRVAASFNAYRVDRANNVYYMTVQGTFRGTETAAEKLTGMGFVFKGDHAQDGVTTSATTYTEGETTVSGTFVPYGGTLAKSGQNAYINYSFEDDGKQHTILCRVTMNGGSFDSTPHTTEIVTSSQLQEGGAN